MGSEFSQPSSLPILAACAPGLRLWPEEIANVTIDGARMTRPEPTGEAPSAIAWTPIGELVTPQIDRSIGLQASRAGFPDLGFEARWNAPDVIDDTGATPWIGWDPPTSIAHAEAVSGSASTDTADQTHTAIAGLPSGAIALAYEDASGGTSYVYVGYRPAGNPSGIAFDQIVAAPTDTAASKFAYPAIVAAGGGRVRLYHLAHNLTSDTCNVWVWDASDSADLSDLNSWTLASRQALSVALDESGSAAGRIRVARSGGQYLMAIGAQQYASADGIRFDFVGEFTALNPAAVGIGGAGGSFIVAIDEGGAGDFAIYRLGDAFARLSAVSPSYTVPSGGGSSGDSVCVAALDDGTIYALAPNPHGLAAFQAAGMFATRDDGLTWSLAGYAFTGLANGPRELAITGYRDRLYAVARRYDGAALIGLHLGGYSGTISLPRFSNTEANFQDGRAAFVRDWTPHAGTPANVYSAATGGAGGTATNNAAGYWRLQSSGATAADYIRYQYPQADNQSEAACVVGAQIDAGALSIRSHCRVGAAGESAVNVVLTPGFIEIFNGLTGASLSGPHAVNAGEIEVLIAHVGITAAIAWRIRGDVEPRVWNVLEPVTLTSIVGASLYYEIRAYGAGGVNADVRLWRFSIAKTTLAVASFGAGLLSGVAEDSPIGRTFGGRPRYVHNGVSFAASGGPAVVGEEWSSAPLGGVYAPDQMFWTADYPSPRQRWRSAVMATETIAFQFGDTGEAIDRITPLWALVIDGGLQAFDYAWHDGTSWGAWNRIYPYVNAKTYTRRGDWVVPSSSSSSGSGPFIQEDELAGGFAVDASGNAREILSNTAGVLGNNTAQTFKVCRVRIAADGSEDSGSVSWRFIPPRVVLTVAPPATIRGFRLRVGIAGFANVPGDKSSIKILIGPAVVLGDAHGKDTTHEYRANGRAYAADNGQRWAARSAPASRVVSLTWQASADRLDPVHGAANIGIAAAANPDYIGAWNGGAPAYSRGEMASTLAALVQRWAADGVPVLYLPYTQRSASGDIPLIYGRRYGSIVGTLSPTFTIEHANSGEEMVSEVVRLGSITIEELT